MHERVRLDHERGTLRMIWRLQRLETVLLVVMLALVTGVFTWLIREVHQTQAMQAQAACVGGGEDYWFSYPVEFWTSMVSGLVGAPVLFALLTVLPLTNEVEAGSWRWAAVQGRSRRSLFMRRMAFAIAVSFGATGLLALSLHRWQHPIDSAWGQLGYSAGYDLRGVLPFALSLFAVALVTCLAIVIRRPLIAIMASIVVYGIVRLGFVFGVRPHLFEPESRTYLDSLGREDWWLTTFWQNGAGGRLSDLEFTARVCPVVLNSPSIDQRYDECVAQSGYALWGTYHDWDRFWPFQVAEAGIFVVISAMLLGFALWWFERRVE